MPILPLLEIPSRLLRLALAPCTRQLANNGRSAADRVRFGLCLGFFLRGHFADLIQVAFEDGCVGDVFGGFGELEEDDACADLEEAHDDRGDFFAGAGEALEEYGRGHDGGAGEEDVVCWGDQGGVEDVQGFL